MYMLDTNTLIYFFKGMGNVGTRLMSVPPKDIGIPAIVLYELELGIARSSSPAKRIKQLDSFCTVTKVFPFTDTEAKVAADICSHLMKKGTPIGPYDILIAATALANNSVLVTNNSKEFKRVRKLKLENWL